MYDNLSKLIERINQLSKNKNISVNKMLSDCGLSKSVVDNMKKGSLPTIDKIQKIADYFDVSTDYLLGKTDIPKAQNIVVTDKNGNQMSLDDETLEYIDSLRTRPEMRVLFSVTNKATKEDIIKAVKIIEALKNESEWHLLNYCIRYINLPCSVHGITIDDGKGFYNIYINADIGYYEQRKAVQHELIHIGRDDFYRTDLPLCEVENM